MDVQRRTDVNVKSMNKSDTRLELTGKTIIGERKEIESDEEHE